MRSMQDGHGAARSVTRDKVIRIAMTRETKYGHKQGQEQRTMSEGVDEDKG